MKQTGENKVLVALLGLIAFLLVGVAYYYVILPKGEEETRIKYAIQGLKIENSELENQVAVLSVVETDDANEYDLRKKLPVSRELDKLLHTIQEVELMSESKIVSISFNNYDAEVSQTITTPEVKEEKVEESAEEVDETETESDSDEEEKEADSEVEETDVELVKPITPIDISLLPEELKLISLKIDLQVLDYDHLLKFLHEIEGLDRVVRIDEVNFYQPGELELAQEEPDKRLDVTVQLTTFFSENMVGD
jgi:type IV pilus assembly protein PilO